MDDRDEYMQADPDLLRMGTTPSPEGERIVERASDEAVAWASAIASENERIERVARAISAASAFGPLVEKFPDAAAEAWRAWEPEARAAIAALSSEREALVGEDEVARFMDAVQFADGGRGGLVFSWEQVENGIRAALAKVEASNVGG